MSEPQTENHWTSSFSVIVIVSLFYKVLNHKLMSWLGLGSLQCQEDQVFLHITQYRLSADDYYHHHRHYSVIKADSGYALSATAMLNFEAFFCKRYYVKSTTANTVLSKISALNMLLERWHSKKSLLLMRNIRYTSKVTF